MIKDLVVARGTQIVCDSRKVSDKFEKKHAYVVDVIRKLISDFDKIKSGFPRPLIQEKEAEYRGRKYTYYEMDKKFFSHLAMRFRGEKAFVWQCKFIDAFFQLEQHILRQKVNQDNLQFKKEREQGKPIRLELANEIKIFIDYAIVNGSQNAQHYYATITKMQYKALGLIEKNEKIDKKFRDTLDLMDLHNLLSSEIIAKKALIDGIEQQLHYKDIFQLAKNRVLQFADIILIDNKT